jgi:hypothetical protein
VSVRDELLSTAALRGRGLLSGSGLRSLGLLGDGSGHVTDSLRVDAWVDARKFGESL